MKSRSRQCHRPPAALAKGPARGTVSPTETSRRARADTPAAGQAPKMAARGRMTFNFKVLGLRDTTPGTWHAACSSDGGLKSVSKAATDPGADGCGRLRAPADLATFDGKGSRMAALARTTGWEFR